MNLIGWNCRGAAGRGFVNLIRDIRSEYNVSMMFMVEIHVSGTRSHNIIKRFGFDSWFIQEAQGQSGGIWIVWDSKDWSVDVLNNDTQ